VEVFFTSLSRDRSLVVARWPITDHLSPITEKKVARRCRSKFAVARNKLCNLVPVKFASNQNVTGKGLLKRIFFTLALTAGLFVLLASLDAEATPIRPDIRKLVEEPPQDTTAHFMPARAGWDGPEMASVEDGVNPAWEAITGPDRANRATLIALATPDPRAVLGIIAVIFLLRILRERDERSNAARAPVAMPPPRDEQDQLAA
jgi:hypothetical protein